jgi:hypothetical protein
MGQHWTVEIEPPKALHGSLELDLLQQAFARDLEQPQLSVEHARRLLVADRFHEVINLLEQRGESDLDLMRCSQLVQAYMSHETETATRRALELARTGTELAETLVARAHMLTLIPSHCYHRTYQHGTSERRICLAFDIWPN